MAIEDERAIGVAPAAVSSPAETDRGGAYLDAARVNAEIWERIYAAGEGDLRYPSDVLVRLLAHVCDPRQDRKVLDFGCGTGANLVHLARLGFEVDGVETSKSALEQTRRRLAAEGLSAHLHLVEAAAGLPFETNRFDVALAWQVLYYGDRASFRAKLDEMERVTRPGGRIIVAIAAPGDVSHVNSESLGYHMYRSGVGNQRGCIVTIPDRDALPELFGRRTLEIGEFRWEFKGSLSRHWVITYGKG